MWLTKSNKFQAYHLKPLGQFSIVYFSTKFMLNTKFILRKTSLIPQWIEHWTYSYQKYTLPIKLRNLLPLL